MTRLLPVLVLLVACGGGAESVVTEAPARPECVEGRFGAPPADLGATPPPEQTAPGDDPAVGCPEP